MVQDKNKPDLVKTPITLAGKMFQSGLNHFQGQVISRAPIDPIREWMREHGIRVKDMR
jgi:hypothetical protein